jgi:ferredoxin-nitrite reductase
MHKQVLFVAAAATVADAFSLAPAAPALSLRRQGVTSLSMSIAEGKKVGTGNNRMTETGFSQPLVKKIEVSHSAGYEYVVVDELNEKKFSPQEKIKKAKPGLAVLDELEMLAEEAKKVGGAHNMKGFEQDVNVRLKWLGLFHRDVIAPGTFMQRFRVPNGKMTSKQWRTAAEIIQEYDQDKNRDMWDQMGCADITTRQNLQIRGLRLENMPRHWKAMRDTGIFSVQSGMDNVRNLVGNPIAGVDPDELVDTRFYCDEFTKKLTNNGNGNPEFSNLPRKFNVCFVGSKELYEHPDINDIAYYPAKNAAGEMGWNIEIGGLLTGTRCEFATPMDAWVPLDKYWEVGAAIMTVFRDFGYRYNPRTKNRLMYLLDDMGVPLFREMVAERYKTATGEDLPTEGSSIVPKTKERKELIGVHKQSDGKNWIGLHVPGSRCYADEMLASADIADKFGDGNVQMTVEGNVLLLGIPDDKLEEAKAAATAIPRWSMTPGGFAKGTVTCTGNQFCGQSKINTKGNSVKFSEMLDEKFDMKEPVRIHWTGCPNTCGQVQIGTIGLLGTQAKNEEGKLVEAVDIFLGGGIGQEGAVGAVYKKGVRVDDQLADELCTIVQEKYGATPKAAVSSGIASTGGFFDRILKMFQQ